MTPLEQIDTPQVPGQVNEHIAGLQKAGELFVVMVGSDTFLHVTHALIEHRLDQGSVIDHVDDGDSIGGHFQMPQQHRQEALRDASATQNQDATVVIDLLTHVLPLSLDDERESLRKPRV